MKTSYSNQWRRPSKLHNFELPQIPTITKRSRSYKPPSQSPPRDSPVIPSRVSPIHGDSSKSKERTMLLEEVSIDFRRRAELYDPRKGKGVIQHNKNHSKNSATSNLKMNEAVSIKTEESENKSKASSEEDEPGSKKSKILIKLGVDNSNNDPTISEMRTRRQKIKLISGGEKTRVLKSPQKNKAWKSGEGSGYKGATNASVSGGDEKEKDGGGGKKEKSGANKLGKDKKHIEEMKGENKKKRVKITIRLTKREIEEDILALTGGKPEGRPKKRTKNMQRNLNAVFPGLCLSSITSEKYKVDVDGPSRKRNC